MNLSSQTKSLKKSATLAINELISQKRKQGLEIDHFGFGESPFPVHPLFQDALKANVDKKSYLPVQGLPELREQISEFYKIVFNLDYSSDQILVAPGSKILIFNALTLLEGPLLLAAPSWVSYHHQARFIGKRVIHINTNPNASYQLTPENLDLALNQSGLKKSEQKILLMNYPCNPTGHSYSKEKLKDLALKCREENIIVLSDEIYALVSFKGQQHHSIAKFYPEGTLLIGGLSKDRSLGGYRLGIMVLPETEENLVSVFNSLGSETYSSASAPIQYAAVEAYKPTPEIMKYIQDCTAIHELFSNYTYERFCQMDIRCPKPRGAFYLFPDWNKYSHKLSDNNIESSKALAEYLLRKWNVATLPGIEFGMADNDFCLRIATVDYDGAEVLRKFKEDPNSAIKDPQKFIELVAPRVINGLNKIDKFTQGLKS